MGNPSWNFAYMRECMRVWITVARQRYGVHVDEKRPEKCSAELKAAIEKIAARVETHHIPMLEAALQTRATELTNIKQRNVDILVDSGATISTVKSSEHVCTLTSRFITTVGVSGIPNEEPLSHQSRDKRRRHKSPIVTDTNSILALLPSNSTHYTVIDLCSAFFSIPLHPDSQYLFAFTFKGKQYTWRRLPQGYVESPTVYAAAVKRDLDDLHFPGGSTLLQYADDLLIASPSEEACRTDSILLLQRLAECGHRASLPKLQFCRSEITYLGHLLKDGQRLLSPERVKLLVNMPPPRTKKGMLSFLEMANYCRHWIYEYAAMDSVLRAATLQSAPTAVQWTDDMQKAFQNLKHALTMAPALGLPDYHQPFHLHVHEREGFATGILVQKHGSHYRPVAYYSSRLTPVVLGMPGCLRAVAAVAILLDKSAPIVLAHDCVVHVPHAVERTVPGAADNQDSFKGRRKGRMDSCHKVQTCPPSCRRGCAGGLGQVTGLKVSGDGEQGGFSAHDTVVVTESSKRGCPLRESPGETNQELASLSKVLESHLNASSRAMLAEHKELQEVKTVVLQNRMALDLLLASQGGTCIFGPWGSNLIKLLTTLLVIILLLILLCACMSWLIKLMVKKTTKSVIQAPQGH
ncbi:uncharacterized protein LOC128379963 [Scomber japonicus]|uniref:uncharacterized protein LOC128379963 n=1 Tax=Scomber japonicus TaxID=13676 RepID=UPI002306AD6D|nr:uncharacterized protein LOC128379963 [Scomber japonicus]